MADEDFLLGAHRLDMIWPDCKHPLGNDGGAVAIELDGKFVLFLEDEDDGYRSSLGAILRADNCPWYNGTPIRRDVLVSKCVKSEYGGEALIFEFRDAKTGKVGLRVGTDDIDDYYPSFVSHYDASAWNDAQAEPGSDNASDGKEST